MNPLLLYSTGRRNVIDILEPDTIQMIERSKTLISVLSNFAPKTDEDIEYINSRYREYLELRYKLNTLVSLELNPKLRASPKLSMTKKEKKEAIIRKNENLIAYLSTFDPFIKEECETARMYFEDYKLLHEKYKNLDHLSLNTKDENPKERKMARRRAIALISNSCQCCGLPLTKTLDVHHRKPVSRWKKKEDPHIVENLSVCCPNCHRFIHHWLVAKKLPDEIQAYLEPFPETVENMRVIVESSKVM